MPRLMRSRALTWRLLTRQLAATVLTVTACAVVIVGWYDPPSSDIYVWWQRASDVVAGAVRRESATGALTIAPTDALRAFIADNPGVEIAAIARPSGEVARGSSAGLVAALRLAEATAPNNAVWELQGRQAGAATLPTGAGMVTVLVAGAHVGLADRVGFVREIAGDILRYLVPALVVMALMIWLVVRATLAPVRRAAAEIAALDFRNLAVRLPTDARVPRELLGLMQGINRALDRLQDGFERQRRFTANAAHEMRTPLAVLRARLDLLGDLPAGAELRLDAERIALLVEQMLAIARLEQRTETIEPLDLSEVVSGVTMDLVPLALDAGRMLEFVPPQAPVVRPAARAALRGAVANLIDNALHAEPPGGTVTVAVSDAGEITVADHGPGIAPQAREQVFEPFWRGDTSRPGSGLGLAIVREIATLLGGVASVRATPGGGATFSLRFDARAT